MAKICAIRPMNNEYDQFLVDWGAIVGKISETEFKQRLADIEMKWTSIDELLPVANEMVRILPQMGDSTYWYKAEDTQPAYRGPLNTLK